MQIKGTSSVRRETRLAASGAQFCSWAGSLSLRLFVMTGDWGISNVLTGKKKVGTDGRARRQVLLLCPVKGDE